MKKFLALTLMCLASPALAQDAAAAADTGNTTWLLVSSALVMLMTPGLAFFYAGMVGRKNVVSTLLQNFVALAVVGVLWAVIGYSLAFSEGSPWIGSTQFAMLDGLSGQLYGDAKVPHYAFVAFQMMFAIITPALFSGAIAERVSFKAWLLILALWSLLVYVPVAHWVWGPGGWIATHGGLDFAGGLVVHLTAGISALVAAIAFGRRAKASSASDIPLIMLGAGLLWFGWFGFNAGSAISSGHLASHAFMTTFLSAATAFLAWMLVDWIKGGKPTAVGAAIGLVVGLVIITPGAGYVSTNAAMLMGVVAGVVCNLVARFVKEKTQIDDSLDVFACHGVGGALGVIMTGIFASSAVNPAVTAQGMAVGGDSTLFMANLTAVGMVAVYAAVVTFVLIKVVGLITPLRVSQSDEAAGLDASMHGEVSCSHDHS